jgi:SAM-dependent methyltransferase
MSVDNITKTEKAKYEKVWTQIESYGYNSPGMAYIEEVIKLCRELGLKSVLDAGCGSGRTTKKFLDEGFDAIGIDLTLKGIREAIPEDKLFEYAIHEIPAMKKDLVYCVDVMEHIPKKLIGLTLKRLSEICGVYAFFVICLIKDGYGKHVDETLHESVLKKEEWEPIISEYFDIDCIKQKGVSLVVMGEPICKACRNE